MWWQPGSRRDRLAALLALVTVGCLGSAFFLFKDTRFLMPGPLASAHGAIENCGACHSKSGGGKLSWIHGLVAGDPLADSKACLTCHKMPDTAFNAHGASPEALKQSTERLTKIAAKSPTPHSARAQGIAFPTHEVVARGLYCATCHQEHQGVNFDLGKISHEQCRSCHVVKFDSFDGHHPTFENYPFESRTRIIYDHAGHFGKHYPELAKKEPARRIPAACSTCHDSRDDKRIMAVAPFDKTCAGCHLDQIIGKERVSGPKGVAFLTLPGLDLATLKTKNASIGEWPDASEAALTPFMKVMISRNDRGRDLVKTVEDLNFQDLAKASDAQIKAVTNLVWEIKGLVHALIKGKASDVLGDLNIASGAKLSADLVADLTASIPRDVVISAQQEWLPNLAAEMANRPDTGDQKQTGWGATITGSNLTGPSAPSVGPRIDGGIAQPQGAAGNADTANGEDGDGGETLSADKSTSAPTESTSQESESSDEPSAADAARAAPSVSPEAKGGETARNVKRDPQACIMSVFGQCVLLKGLEEAKEAKLEGAGGQTGAADQKTGGGKETISTREPPGKMNAGVKDAGKAAHPAGADGQAEAANAKPGDGKETIGAGERDGATTGARLPLPSGTPRAIKARSQEAKEPAEAEEAEEAAEPGGAEKAAEPKPGAPKSDAANAKSDGGDETPAADEPPRGKATDQSDDLLFPTEEELRAIKAARPDGAAGKTDAASARPGGAQSADAAAGAPADSGAAAAAPQTSPAPVISIESDVDPESWAEYGGWYRQDYAIFYRPIGHKDKFAYSWLFLTGPQAPKGDMSPAAAVFDYLTSKDAQGSCTKCHSVDDLQGKGRVVNFSPRSVENKQGRFTYFIHEPHFGVLENRTGALENRGCLSCHNLEKRQPEEAAGKTDAANSKPDVAASADAASKANAASPAGAPADSGAAAADKDAEKAGSPYLKSYEQGNPQSFVSNFGAVKKDLCQTCHTSSKSRQDCLTCHKYHVNGVITPIMKTKIPIQ